MREILFRGKRKDNGEWVEGDLLKYETGETAILSGFSRYGFEATEIYLRNKVIPETVCQFTGLYGKNGRKIFEGDIVVFADFFNDEIHRGVVYWCDLAFWFDCTETEGDEGIYSLAYISANILEVIGNIYDNPELLEVKQNG